MDHGIFEQWMTIMIYMCSDTVDDNHDLHVLI